MSVITKEKESAIMESFEFLSEDNLKIKELDRRLAFNVLAPDTGANSCWTVCTKCHLTVVTGIRG